MLILSLVLFLAACRAFALGYTPIGLAFIYLFCGVLLSAGVRAIFVRMVATKVMDLFDDNRQEFYFPHEVAHALKQKDGGAPQLWLMQRALDYLCRIGLLEKVMCGFDEKQRPKYRKKVPVPSFRFA